MYLSHFTSRPEFRLALRITGTVLLALIGVVVISTFFASITDTARQEDSFRLREETIQSQSGFVENIKKPVSMPMMGRGGKGRRFMASSLRNIIVLYPD